MKSAMIVLAMATATDGAAHASGDPANGRAKSVQCVACHGIDGVTPNPTFPHIAGQNASYLQIQLDAFREGKRYHELMTPVAQSLTDRDVADLVAYYSRIPLRPAAPARE